MAEYTEGTVSKSRGKWRGRISYKDEGGDWRRLSKTFNIPCEEGSNRGRAAALKALAEWRAELTAQDEAEQVRATLESTPTAAYCTAHVERLAKLGHIERSTHRDYMNSIRHLGGIASIPLCDLKRRDVEAWVESQVEDGYAPATILKRLRILRECTRYAVEVEDLPRDPTLGVKAPKQRTQRKNALDAAQRQKLMEMLEGMEPTPLKAAVALALFGGLRLGEVCALRWKSVDLRGGSLRVCEAISNAEGGTYEKKPKNESSDREFPMPEPLRAALAERREAMLDECIASGVMLSGDMRVCGGVDGSYPNPTHLGKQWSVLASSIGLRGVTGRRPTFHDLRHTFATVGVNEGVDVRTVADMLGHADPAMTLRVYAVSAPEAKRRAAETLSEAFRRPVADVIEFKRAAGGE